MTVRSMIHVEDELGCKIAELGNFIGIGEAAIMVKHAIRNVDDTPVTPEEWERIVDDADISEMFEALEKIVKSITSTTKGDDESTKN